MSRLVVVHDVLGTLFSLTSPIDELKSIFADQLSNESAPPILPELVIMDWYHAAQRDFTTLSMNGAYQPISAVFQGTLPRILLQAGLLPPEQYSKKARQETSAKAGSGIPLPGNSDPFPSLVAERMMSSLGNLRPRPGMVEAFTQIYRDQKKVPSSIAQVELWGATNGGLALGQKLFSAALGDSYAIYTGQGVSEKQQKGAGKGIGVGLFSCDEIKVAKPEPQVYQFLRRRIEDEEGGKKENKSGNTSLWFVASHTWDLFAARKAGFKTAWVGYEEFFTCPSIYEQPDIIATDLQDVAQKILARESGMVGQ